MASDFTPSSIKKSGGGGGVEGGIDSHPLTPLEVPVDKIVVEDIRTEPISDNFQGEEMPDVNEEEIVAPEVIEDVLEPSPEESTPEDALDAEEHVEAPEVIVDVLEEIVETEVAPDVPQKQLSDAEELLRWQRMWQMPPKEEIVEENQKATQIQEPEQRHRKKKVAYEQPEEYSNIFSRMWNGFFDLFEFKSHREKAFTKSFVSVAVIISLISMFHVQGLFALVNTFWLSWVIAFAIELAVIVSLFSLKMLDRVSSWMIWTLIFILFLLQAVGNTFSAFVALDVHNGLISQLIDMINVFGVAKESIWLKRVIAFMVGGVLPLLAFLFIKSISEYLDNSEEEFYEEEAD